MDTTPAVKLRANVVLLVVIAIILLALGLYGATVALVVSGRSVPGELWLAAGNASGALITLLVNTKHEPTAADPAPVQVVNAPDQPVPVDTTGDTLNDPGPDDAAEPQPIGDAAS
jgi:hypothetical protein